MSESYQNQLRDTVRYLGRTLGETIRRELGEEWLARIEEVRKTGRRSYQGDTNASDQLAALFKTMSDIDLLTIGRAFAQFLNLGNIAEQEYISNQSNNTDLELLFDKLNSVVDEGTTKEQLRDAVNLLDIDLVLTAHPTEVTRRTLIHKHTQLAQCLQQLHSNDLNDYQRTQVEQRITDLITQAWHTEEIRYERPTPVDEARWGFAVIENSLWQAVPEFLREFDYKLQTQFDIKLPLNSAPIHFSSWMGGDRDGNPNVTSKVTETTLLLARRRAAKLFADDIGKLQTELSMRACNSEVRKVVGDAREPYRVLLNPVHQQLEKTHEDIKNYLTNLPCNEESWIENNETLLEPLLMCHRSLIECGLEVSANGLLLDIIRRVHCFGIHLLRLDIRQDSERHTQVLSELTRYLGLGDFAQWNEEDKQAFLLRELSSKRPLIPLNWNPSENVNEVLKTCQVIAKHHRDSLGIYIISMASEPSDVLAVQLILREMGVSWPMPVAPLFETLDDLNHSPDVISKLLSIDWYRGYIKGRQYVMIGYSDSAKDAGALAAGWAQYQAQEKLVSLCKDHDTEITLFHGRGGTIGRGGLPAQSAIYSQPPGSLDGGFRVTEQGETIRYKFGMPKLAKRSLSIYTSAILQAVLMPPPVPKDTWRSLISNMADQGCKNYRSVVRDNADFVKYFRIATPEQELGKLPLGSRPAKRKASGGIESLRAIPWIFAWAQTRLVLPAWLGVIKAIKANQSEDSQQTLNDMTHHWPFFQSRLSMLDMVFHKADPRIAKAYDDALVPDEQRAFGENLREELSQSIDTLLNILGHETIMQDDPRGRESMNIRASYLEPLHFLQIELLKRIRQKTDVSTDTDLQNAMMVTISGIAIGMRNTG